MWSRGVLVTMLGACFSPHAPSGSPCDPVLANCPSGLVCYAVGGDFRCLAEAPGDDATLGDDAAMADAMTIDGTPDAMAMPVTLTYTATVADCVEPGEPNPQECIDVNGAMAIDASDTATQKPWVAYVRFDIDNQLAGKTVTSVKLRMTTTPEAKSAADNSGVVWRVQPFTHAMLSTSVPTIIGTAPLAPTQGAVTPNDVVEWTLPTTLVTASTGVYLSITTPSDDGTVYGDLNTTFPPTLIVVAQ